MRTHRLPPQIVRLVLLTVAIVGSYLVARSFLTPASFGEYGWYRGDALIELASHPAVYAGRKACEDCHYDEFETLKQFEHKTLSCEGCHGPGGEHAGNPDVKLAILNYSHCARCHEFNPSRPSWHKQVNLKDHYAGDACTECHVPHAPGQVPGEETTPP